MENKKLSIVMPTHNRAEFLDYSLEVHIPIFKRHNIKIYIFDNASTDNTEKVVQKWMKEYIYLIYHKHEINIGGIMNFEYALKYPETDYVWLVGDTYQLQEGVVNYVLNILKNTNYILDAIALNLDNNIKIPTKNYDNSNLLLNELGALLTCAAVSIISRKMIREEIFQRYRLVWFTHAAIIFEDIADKNFLIHWAQTQSVTGLINKNLTKTNWSHTAKAFEVGCEDWTNFIMSLPPSYKINNKMKCIMDFGKVSGLFTLKSLILLRINGILNFKIFNKYKKLFAFTIDFPIFLILIIVITPKFILKLLKLFVVILKKVI